MSRAVLLSMKPRFARAILEGRKSVEVRRKFPSIPAGTVVVIYASFPERAVVGTVRLRQTISVSPDRVWDLYSASIDIDQAELDAYLDGAGTSVLLEVDSPDEWSAPVALDKLRNILGIEPPQSFRYLRDEQVQLIRASISK